MPKAGQIKNHGPFHVSSKVRNPLGRGLMAFARPGIERMLALPALNRIYEHVHQLPEDDRSFTEKVLDYLDIDYRLSQEQVKDIPRQGPLVVVANHPFGGIDGLVMIALLSKVRPDAKLLANFFLQQIPELREKFIFVDPFGGAEARQRNFSSMKTALRFVRDGGCLATFPSGEVSQVNLQRRRVTDPAWSSTIGRIIQQTRAPVLPLFFEGRNSALFQALGLIHPRLRTVMLPRELLKKRRSTVRVRAGNMIPTSRLKSFDDPGDLISYLRVRTYILRARIDEPIASATRRPAHSLANARAIIDPVPAGELAKQVASLPPEQCLASHRDVDVYHASAEQMGPLMREIGRLRELTFRNADEGTGKEIDLDRFDEYYHHLFVWNKEKQQVVGAYRIGLTDRILAEHGVSGLYTATLFRFREKLLREIGPALELGRSFVRPECQKEFAPLMLLWRGIGQYVCRFPKYRTLFGPVSINNEYNSLSKRLLIWFLKYNRYLPNLGKLLEPRNPPRLGPIREWDPRTTGTLVRNAEEVDELVREIEADRRSMPVLLRQYLKLNAKLLGFNVDPDFGDVLDGLVLVDLIDVDRTILKRYMGKENAKQFLAYHNIESES